MSQYRQWVHKAPEPVIRETEITGRGVPTTALYRMYDKDGNLLYVGVSDDLRGRFKFHRGYAGWWHKTTRKTVTWYGTRQLALAAEDHAIKTERPAYNIQGQLPPGVSARTGRRKGTLTEDEIAYFGVV